MSVKDPDQLYLLDVMKVFCRDNESKDLSQLAQECMDDRYGYLLAQSKVVKEIFFQQCVSGHA